METIKRYDKRLYEKIVPIFVLELEPQEVRDIYALSLNSQIAFVKNKLLPILTEYLSEYDSGQIEQRAQAEYANKDYFNLK